VPVAGAIHPARVVREAATVVSSQVNQRFMGIVYCLLAVEVVAHTTITLVAMEVVVLEA
jgi:hypothetical protein